MFKTVITDCDYGSIENEIKILDGISKIELHRCRTENEVAAVCSDADALMVEYAPVSRQAIESMKKCKVIVRYGVGYDSIDVKAATEKGIPVVNVPEYCTDEVADHTVALMLALLRKIVFLNEGVARGNWSLEPFKPIISLSCSKIGLLAFGSISMAVAQRLKPFGVNLLVYAPGKPAKLIEAYGGNKVTFEKLLTESDLISIHAPLKEDTRHIISIDELCRMKKNAYIVNTSRGGLVDTAALISAVEDGRIAGAALDVSEEEPLPADSPLRYMNNIIVTPHAGFYSEQSIVRLQSEAAVAVRQVLTGEGFPENTINRKGLVGEQF